jgi:alkanesulfonate monooxygenase SsuD/methylene tetrahydromethanopterin reductase-like flavin-dependent oxidoreductase (luciferase family)
VLSLDRVEKEETMKLGLALPHGRQGTTPDVIRELARTAEGLGYDSLWAIERDIFPARQGALTSTDRSARDAVRDPLTALAFAATGTDHVRIGLSVVNVPFHSPVALATSLSALDRLSNGRAQVGVGIGYSEPECRAVTSFLERKTPASEFMEVFESLWRGSDAGYQGDYFFIPKGVVIPEPVQAPSPPISLVAFAPAAVLPSATLVSGHVSAHPAMPQRSQMSEVLRGACAAASMCPAGAGLTVRARIIVTAEALGPERAMFHGSPSQVRSDIAQAGAQGVAELMFDPGDIEGDSDLAWTLASMRMVREMAGMATPRLLAASA